MPKGTRGAPASPTVSHPGSFFFSHRPHASPAPATASIQSWLRVTREHNLPLLTSFPDANEKTAPWAVDAVIHHAFMRIQTRHESPFATTCEVVVISILNPQPPPSPPPPLHMLISAPSAPLEFNLPNKRGTVTMARWEDVNSGSGEFFINLKDSPHLDRTGDSGWALGFTVFGEVVAGLDVADRLSLLHTVEKGGMKMLEPPVEMRRVKLN